MVYKTVDPFRVQFFSKIQAIADKFEADLVASGYTYVRTEDNHKIYVEKETGRIVPVLIPTLPSK
jgi:hypothetical protein